MENETFNRYVKFEAKAKGLAVCNLIAAVCFSIACIAFAYQGHIATGVSALAAALFFMNYVRFSSDFRTKLEIIKELQAIKRAMKI